MADEKYLVIARKWRPQTFDAVVGQEHITRTLRNAIRSGRIGHAFLFIGSRGIGKTTTARLLAKALNCASSDVPTTDPCGTCSNCTSIAAGTNIDVMEIDGASNNSVDDVRQIRENVRLVPSRSRFKVYVIDEVHQLSSSAFNALLKTLEEPPEHAVFVLATTEAHKVPATIISRCQRYDFRRVGVEPVANLLRGILDSEGITCSEEALQAIARAGDGSVRDAESILEQLVSYCGNEITFQDVFDVLGLVDWKVFHGLCEAMLDKDIGRQLRIVEDIVLQGKDLSQFAQEVLRYFRNLLVCKTADAHDLIALPEEDIALMQQYADQFSLTALIRLVEQFAELGKDFDSQIAQRIALETLLIRLSKVSVEMSVDAVLEKLAQLGAGGISAAPAASAAPRPPRPAPAKPPAPTPQSNGNAALAPEAAPEEAAPPMGDAAPEPEPPRAHQKVELTRDNVRHHWESLTHNMSSDNLNLAIALGHGIPVDVKGDAVVLQFSARQERSRDIVERAGNAEVLEAALAAYSSNAKRVECVVDDSDEPEAETEQNGIPRGGGVTQAQAQLALENPDVAKVVDVFKGHIVGVKKPEQENADE